MHNIKLQKKYWYHPCLLLLILGASDRGKTTTPAKTVDKKKYNYHSYHYNTNFTHFPPKILINYAEKIKTEETSNHQIVLLSNSLV